MKIMRLALHSLHKQHQASAIDDMRISLPLAVGIIIALHGFCVSPAFALRGPNTLVVFSATDFEATKSAAEEMTELGARVFNIVPPNVYFVKMSSETTGEVSHRKTALGIFKMTRSKLDPKKVESLGEDTEFGVRVWNALLQAEKDDTAQKREVDLPELQDAVFVAPPPQESSLTRTRSGLNSPPFGSAAVDLSEYMVANPMKDPNILINVIFPESTGAIDGNQATWTIPELDFAVAKIFNGCNWWAVNAPSCIQLRFILEGQLVTTSYEPINRTGPSGGPPGCPGSGGQGLWINEIMDTVFPPGAGFACYFDKVRGYANQRRLFYDTDWAITFFVVDDDGDPDAGFVDGFFAYTYLGGPFIVMTKRNDGWGFFNMDAVTAHEVGHNFYAQDEYCVATAPSSGYLNIPNGNSLTLFLGECPTAVPWLSTAGQKCIMRGGTLPFVNNEICSFTNDAIGWRDLDGDTIPDVSDTQPIIQALVSQGGFIFPCTSAMPFVGIAHVNPLNNINPFGAGNDISINTINNVFFIADPPSPPALTLPATGVFDTGIELFSFSMGPLSPGLLHTVDVFAESKTGCAGQFILGPVRTGQVAVLPCGVQRTLCP